MPITKTRTSIWASQVLTAGAGNITSSVIDLSNAYAALCNIKLSNGAAGPTVAAQVQMQVANDYNAGSPTLLVNFGGALVGGTTNNGIYYCSAEIPMAASALQLIAGSNTVQNVTVDADVGKVTGV